MKRRHYFLLLFVAIVAMAFYTEVDNSVTSEDKEALTKLGRLENTSHLNNVEKAAVLIDQMKILIRQDYAIPKRNPREPSDLLRFRTGRGKDWARTAYKLFRLHNIPVRQISLYQMENGFFEWLKPGLPSMAALEIQHDGTWIFVEPLSGWMSIKKNGEYGSTADLNDQDIQWKDALGQRLHQFRKKPFRKVYGLYSRHGQFYPPYLPFPDFNWQQFKLNF